MLDDCQSNTNQTKPQYHHFCSFVSFVGLFFMLLLVFFTFNMNKKIIYAFFLVAYSFFLLILLNHAPFLYILKQKKKKYLCCFQIIIFFQFLWTEFWNQRVHFFWGRKKIIINYATTMTRICKQINEHTKECIKWGSKQKSARRLCWFFNPFFTFLCNELLPNRSRLNCISVVFFQVFCKWMKRKKRRERDKVIFTGCLHSNRYIDIYYVYWETRPKKCTTSWFMHIQKDFFVHCRPDEKKIAQILRFTCINARHT